MNKFINWDTLGIKTHKEKYGFENLRMVKRKCFLKVSKKRKKEIIEWLDNLGKCSNKSHYSYTRRDVNELFKEIQQYLEETRKKFEKS